MTTLLIGICIGILIHRLRFQSHKKQLQTTICQHLGFQSFGNVLRIYEVAGKDFSDQIEFILKGNKKNADTDADK